MTSQAAEKQRWPLVLSLDDRWNTSRDQAPKDFTMRLVDEALKAWSQGKPLELARCQSLVQAASRLKKAQQQEQAVALLVLDVMLNLEPDDNFKAFGWPEELKPMDAGVQLASLLVKTDNALPAERPWLNHCQSASLMLLTTSGDVVATINRLQLGAEPRLTWCDKNTVLQGAERLTAAMDEALAAWNGRVDAAKQDKP